MALDRFEELLSLLLDETASADEIAELAAMCREDAARLQEMRDHLQISDRLSQYESELRGESAFVESLASRVAATDRSDGFVRDVLQAAQEEAATMHQP